MNAFEFDNVLVPGSTAAEFYRFCRRKKPSLIWRYGMEQLFGYVYYGMGGVSRTTLQEYVFSYLRGIEDVESWVTEFWAGRTWELPSWAKDVLRPGDVVLSSAPEFLLRPVCEELGVALLASPVDPKTGKFHGECCREEEKVRRFRARYGDATVENFYSDALSDLPMAKLAANAWFVINGKPESWEKTWRTKL